MTAPGAEPIADAGAALGRLIERLVISYSLDLAAATFTLVADYPDRAPGAQRSFVALRFSSVRGFRRYPGNLAELHAFTDTYSTAGDEPVETRVHDHRGRGPPRAQSRNVVGCFTVGPR